ncbi:transcriptional regulator [Haladaptatus halobius]|uniref:transcriptional regulator n=1 Tax=Haladaptatus halobius TaxID=2884875 RepID=UPI001D0B80EE|nr:transcriptional regulator [Haladaptatus halobius]
MEDDTHAGTPAPDEIAAQLGEQRRNLLTVFKEADTRELDTSTLRQRSGVPSGSMNHHLNTLERWGLITETAERQYVSHGGSKARVWRLTDEGETFTETQMDDAVTPGVTTDALHEQIQAQQDEIDALRSDLEDTQKMLVKVAQQADLIDDEKAAALLQ